VLDRPSVCKDERQARSKGSLKLDAVAQKPFEGGDKCLEFSVETNGLKAKGLAAAYGNELTGQGSSAICGGGDLGELLRVALVLRLSEQEVGVPIDNRQNVVEMMGKSTRHLSD
jgi:hypothetical protein